MVNSKGQTVLVLFMLAILVIVLAIGLMKPTTDLVQGTRGVNNSIGGDGLNCSNPDLSDYDKGACGITDLTPFYFIAGLIVVAGIIAHAKGII